MSTETPEQKLQAMLATLWQKSRHTVAERGALLQQVWTRLAEGKMDEASRLGAVDSAHKLAGVLGTFGIPRGTDLAREAEVLFDHAQPFAQADIDRLQILLTELKGLIELGPPQPHRGE